MAGLVSKTAQTIAQLYQDASKGRVTFAEIRSSVERICAGKSEAEVKVMAEQANVLSAKGKKRNIEAIITACGEMLANFQRNGPGTKPFSAALEQPVEKTLEQAKAEWEELLR